MDASEEMAAFWESAIDWGRVEARVAELPHVGSVVTLEQLRHPRSTPTYGIHPLARELGTCRLDNVTSRLERDLGRIRGLPRAHCVIDELPKLGDPSSNYWSWLSEIEVASLLQSKGLAPVFRHPARGPDFLVRVCPGEMLVEATASLKQEIGLFELKQLLQHEFGERFYIDTVRQRHGRSPMAPPRFVWKVFQEVSSCLKGKPGTGTLRRPYEAPNGVWFEVVAHGKCAESRPTFGSPMVEPEGDPRCTLKVRTREICTRKHRQVVGAGLPTALVICLVQDVPMARAFRDARQSCGGWEPAREDTSGIPAIVYYDTGDRPPRIYRAWIDPEGVCPKLAAFREAMLIGG